MPDVVAVGWMCIIFWSLSVDAGEPAYLAIAADFPIAIVGEAKLIIAVDFPIVIAGDPSEE